MPARLHLDNRSLLEFVEDDSRRMPLNLCGTRCVSSSALHLLTLPKRWCSIGSVTIDL